MTVLTVSCSNRRNIIGEYVELAEARHLNDF